MANIEAQSLLEGEARVKFKANWIGSLQDFFKAWPSCVDQYQQTCSVLKEHIHQLEKCGVTPVMPDGKVGGNAGAVIIPEDASNEFIVVSKSGKKGHTEMDIYHDFTVVKSFDTENWSCDYYARDHTVLPTSDTPLYFTAFEAHLKLGWKSRPTYLLHGHAFASEEEAKKYRFPISTKETLFSTPEDAQELFDLMKEHPFPESKVYIRKGHGFILVGASPKDAWQVFQNRMEAVLAKE